MISLLDKLANRAYDLLSGRWFQLGEPLVSTFSREMVDDQNNTVLTWDQAEALADYLESDVFPGAGGGGNPSTLLRIQAITNGADFVVVTGLGLSATPTKCLVSVMKMAGDFNLFATCRLDTLTTDGFTADLSAAVDNGNYVLVYIIT
jgi:hypothetical protein